MKILRSARCDNECDLLKFSIHYEKRVAAAIKAIHHGRYDIIARIRDVKGLDRLATLCRDNCLDWLRDCVVAVNDERRGDRR